MNPTDPTDGRFADLISSTRKLLELIDQVALSAPRLTAPEQDAIARFGRWARSQEGQAVQEYLRQEAEIQPSTEDAEGQDSAPDREENGNGEFTPITPQW